LAPDPIGLTELGSDHHHYLSDGVFPVRLRLHFRVRTLLIAVAVLSPLLACAAIVVRETWYKDFQAYHVRQAYRLWCDGLDLRLQADNLQKNGQASPQEVEEIRRRSDKALREAHWHEFWSGRPATRVRL
jgi:hypothetical protein